MITPTTSLDRLCVFIMAGGSGERFWPASRAATPKHLLKLLGEQTLLEQTVRRFEGIISLEQIFILTNVTQLQSTKEALPFLPANNIIAEPAKRDTAPAAALATGFAMRHLPDAIVALFPADAMIHDTATFRTQIADAATYAGEHSSIITFSITPNHPSTGFGYLQLGEELKQMNQSRFVRVERFVEKPDIARAQEFFEGKKHGWNAGMFLWKGNLFREECSKQQPELAEFITGLQKSSNIERFMTEEFPKLPKISVDYAIMEDARSVTAVIAEYDWDDVGSWTALPAHLGKDKHENTIKGPVITSDAHRNIVVSEKRTVALCGVSDLVVVETDDAVLVCHRDAVQKIKNLPVPRELK